MAQVTIRQGERRVCVSFEGARPLSSVLAELDFPVAQPCGGRGVCGKCAISAAGAISPLSEAERRAGTRLACQTLLLGDCEIVLPLCAPMKQIELSAQGETLSEAAQPMPGRYGAAVDVGTTTLALQLLELPSGRSVGSAAAINPQTTVAADVVGRIGAALEGQAERMRRQATDALQRLLNAACEEAGVDGREVESMVITGNTTMLHLLTGTPVDTLARAPFLPQTLFGETRTVLGRTVYLPPCAGAFVGADTVCAVLSAELCRQGKTTALMDIGTNGEIALWHGGELYLCSTAAGPVFEGAGISCGCASVTGAIDRVWVEGGALGVHTIGNAPPVGVCGSGLVDAVAAMRALGWIDETGAADSARLPLTENIYLMPEDIRGVQMAKAAMAAGLSLLLETAGIPAQDVSALHIAGGFGSHVSPQSAAAIGLIPRELAGRVCVAGNAALAGAMLLLKDMRRWAEARELAKSAHVIPLGGSARFEELFMARMGL